MTKCVMIVGLGDLGGWVLEFLARCQCVSRIVTADIKEEWGKAKTMTAAVGASQQGFNKRLEFHKLDLYDINRTAELLNSIQPDFIYSAATLQSWWVPLLLPHEVSLKSELAGIAPQVSSQMLLIYKLMQAVKKSGIKAKVLNNSYPDLVNPILWRNGLGPETGSGNSDLVMEDIRQKVSYDLNIPPQEIAVYLYTAHSMCTLANLKDIPFILKIYAAGLDVTSNYDSKKLVRRFNASLLNAETTSWIAHPRVAASAVKNLMAMINNTNELTHVCGPKGLPGGYSVRMSAVGPEVILTEGVTMEDALKVNLDALKFDGVEEIKEDGTVVFTEESRQLTKEWLGMDCGRELRLADIEEHAKEVLSATNKLALKYGIKLKL